MEWVALKKSVIWLTTAACVCIHDGGMIPSCQAEAEDWCGICLYSDQQAALRSGSHVSHHDKAKLAYIAGMTSFENQKVASLCELLLTSWSPTCACSAGMSVWPAASLLSQAAIPRPGCKLRYAPKQLGPVRKKLQLLEQGPE